MKTAKLGHLTILTCSLLECVESKLRINQSMYVVMYTKAVRICSKMLYNIQLHGDCFIRVSFTLNLLGGANNYYDAESGAWFTSHAL